MAAGSSELELDNVFVKHYAPNHMLAPKITEALSEFYGIYPETDQVIYTMDPNCMPIMILAQAVILLFCSEVSFTTQYGKAGKGR